MEKDKVALVTESGNGLGKSFAEILERNNYKVILAADIVNYKSLFKDLSIHNEIDLCEIDFRSENSLLNLKSMIVSKYGHLDVLVNNAEIANGFGQKIEEIDLDEVRELYEVNLFSVIKIVQLFKPLLEKSNKPSIINITSSLGDIHKMSDKEFCYSDYCMTAYSTSKAALDMYTYLQSREFQLSKISISAFDPIVPNNCTHNSVNLCNGMEQDFISLIK